MLVKLVHPKNAESFIFIMLFGIIILVNPVQSENALSSIFVTLSGIVKLPIFPSG